MHDSYVIRSRRVVTDDGIHPADISISGTIIDGVSEYGGSASKDVIDCGDLVVMPGLIDAHVHINEPGRTDWEGFESGTKAAIAGGVTTIVDMPLNSSPVTTTLDAFGEKISATRNQLYANCGFYGGVVPGNLEHLPALIDAGILGLKAFLVHSGIDDFPASGKETLKAAMQLLAGYKLPVLAHCELPRSGTAKIQGDPRVYNNYLSSRPELWEHNAIALMIDLCRETKCPVHVVHLSAASCLDLIRSARDEGLPVTVETCPHYLYFNAESIPDGSTLHKCAPPIRDEENGRRLWQAVENGDIDFIASDHSPCLPEMKRLESGNFAEAWGGIPSIQLTLAIMCTLARKRKLSLDKVSYLLSARPAEFLGLESRKGSIREGFDADIVIWNPEQRFEVTADGLHFRHKVSPYVGHTLYGEVITTIVNGSIAFKNNTTSDIPHGKTVFSS